MPDLSTAPVEGLLEPVPPEPAGAQARLFDAVLGALGYVASERPFALIIEDIHWVDGSTRDLVRFLVRNVDTQRMAMVLTYRSDDLHRRHPLMPLLAELERSDRTERLDHSPFDHDELSAQLEGILGEPPSASFVDELLERSNGLPFYVEELVAGQGETMSALPVTLRDVLASLPRVTPTGRSVPPVHQRKDSQRSRLKRGDQAGRAVAV